MQLSGLKETPKFSSCLENSYEAAGNMTSNGTATYTYDAENREAGPPFAIFKGWESGYPLLAPPLKQQRPVRPAEAEGI